MGGECMRLKPGDALVIVDVQRDFCASGALAVPDADSILPTVNALIEEAVAAGATVIASRDWHPPSHASFQEAGGDWPAHCVQGSAGAQFHPDLRLPEQAIIVSKGEALERDQFSAFDAPGLADRLRLVGARRVLIVGLALDICVLETALAAAAQGFETHVRLSGARAMTAEGAKVAVNKMRKAHVVVEQR